MNQNSEHIPLLDIAGAGNRNEQHQQQTDEEQRQQQQQTDEEQRQQQQQTDEEQRQQQHQTDEEQRQQQRHEFESVDLQSDNSDEHRTYDFFSI